MSDRAETTVGGIDPSTLPKPTQDFMLLHRDTEPRMENGILIPVSEELPICVVMAVGPGKYVDGVFITPTVKPGDRVLLNLGPDGVSTFRWLGKTYALAPVETAAAVLPPESLVALANSSVGSLPRVTLQ